jgi:hypothetical protein
MVNFLHFLNAVLEFGLIVRQSHLDFKSFHDFAYVFELIEHLLVVTAALGRGSCGNKGGQFVVELHFPKFRIDITSFFS